MSDDKATAARTAEAIIALINSKPDSPTKAEIEAIIDPDPGPCMTAPMEPMVIPFDDTREDWLEYMPIIHMAFAV